MPALWPLIFVAALSADVFRKWTDPAGQLVIVASLVEVIDQQMSLKESDGTAVQVSVSRVSQADREYLNGVYARRVANNRKGIASRRAYLKKHQKSGNSKGIAYEVKFIKILTTVRTSLMKGDIPRPTVPPPLPKKPPPPVRELDPLNLAVGQKGRLSPAGYASVTYHVFQVLDDGVLVDVRYKRCRIRTRGRGITQTYSSVPGVEQLGPTLFFSGVPVEKLADGAKFAPPGLVHVKSIKRDGTVSVFHLVPAKR